LQVVERYAERGGNKWGPLLQRILQSRIRDWLSGTAEEEHADPIQNPLIQA
jgi:hypothetical protein